MIQKRESGPVRLKEAEENAGPTTTVFVGNISEKASDMLVRQLLAVSGPPGVLAPPIPRSSLGDTSVCICLWLIWISHFRNVASF